MCVKDIAIDGVTATWVGSDRHIESPKGNLMKHTIDERISTCPKKQNHTHSLSLSHVSCGM